MDSLSIYIAWPDRATSPNARHGHWGAAARAKKRQRAWAKLLALREFGRLKPPRWPAAALMIDAIPPTRRRRDGDNLVASLKGAIDGLADAGVVIDDSAFRLEPVEFHEPSRENPGVWLTVWPLPTTVEAKE